MPGVGGVQLPILRSPIRCPIQQQTGAGGACPAAPELRQHTELHDEALAVLRGVQCCKGRVGGAIAILFRPLGFGEWQPVAAAISGFSAKEGIVSTMGVLANVAGDVEDAETVAEGVGMWFPTALAGFSFLLFNLLDSPCLAAISTMAQQMQDRKWFWFAIGYQCILAYIVSLCIYQIGTLITVGTFGVGTVVAFLLIIGFIYLLFRPYKESNTLNFDAKKTVSAK